MDFIFIFLLGLAVGSFINAAEYRHKFGGSIAFGRSQCPKCGHVLAWYELVPILSFAAQLGRCRSCKQKISWQYPLVELAAGFLFLFAYYQIFFLSQGFGVQAIFNFQLWYLFAVFGALLFIFIFDLKYYIIPNSAVYSLIIIALLHNVLRFDFSQNIGYILSAVAASAFFLSLYLVSKGTWIGFGDVKFGLFMGLFLGWPGILAALFLSYVLGALIGIFLLIKGKKTLKSQVPFGPFLVLGTLTAFFYGSKIINWYLTFLSF